VSTAGLWFALGPGGSGNLLSIQRLPGAQSAVCWRCGVPLELRAADESGCDRAVLSPAQVWSALFRFWLAARQLSPVLLLERSLARAARAAQRLLLPEQDPPHEFAVRAGGDQQPQDRAELLRRRAVRFRQSQRQRR